MSRGHDLNKLISEYPIPLLYKLSEWAHKNDVEEKENISKYFAIASRMAYHSDAKDFKKYISGDSGAGLTRSELAKLKRLGKNGK